MTKYYRRFIDPRDQYRRWIDPRFRTLRLPDVTAYLVRNGWKQVPPDRRGFLVFQEPTTTAENGEPLFQFVPDSEEYSDYALRLFEFLTGLAEFEQRQVSEIIDNILRQTPASNSTTGSPVAPLSPPVVRQAR